MNKEDKNNGFKFAVSAITALLTFAYFLYKYIQNTANFNELYTLAVFLINSAIIASIFFICYIICKGFTMEIKNQYLKKKVDNFASDIYILSFFISIIIFILMIILSFAITSENYNITVFITINITIIISGAYLYGQFCYRNQTQTRLEKRILQASDGIKSLKWLDTLVNAALFSKLKKILPDEVVSKMLLFLILIFFLYLYSILPYAFITIFTQGDVTIDMENIHYKNESQIPINIAATGPVSFLSINLLKENSDHNLTLNDSIKLNLDHNSNKITHGNNSILAGNSLNNGRYNVFVNTTNLKAGYYELVCVKHEEYAKGFYLLNN